MAKILVVDDEMGIRELLSEILDDEGHEILLAENAAAARAQYAKSELDLVLLDIWMPDTDGMSLLREWTSAAPLRCSVIMMSGHASIDTAVEAQELGAVGFLEKPITMHKLLAAVHKALYRSSSGSSSSSSSGSSSSASTAVSAPPIAIELMADAPNSVAQPSTTEFAPIGSSVPTQAVPQSAPAPALSHWHEALSQVKLDTGLREFREEVERIYFNYVIDREQWAMTKIAEQAGLERTHLYRKLKQLNIEITRKAKT
jgi:DNA-binding NtrC family response regulator